MATRKAVALGDPKLVIPAIATRKTVGPSAPTKAPAPVTTVDEVPVLDLNEGF